MTMAVSLHNAANENQTAAAHGLRSRLAGRRPAPRACRQRRDVGVGQRALDEPDGINGGERHGPESDRGNAHQAHSQSPDRRKAKGGNDEHGLARDLGKKARAFHHSAR